MRTKIDLPESRPIYARRLAIVEPVFANIRTAKGMNRFTYRGKDKVNTQWLLYCLVHNFEKIAHYGLKWLERVCLFAAQGLQMLLIAAIRLFHASWGTIFPRSSSNPLCSSLVICHAS